MGRRNWQGESQLYATIWYIFGRVSTCLQKRTENGAIKLTCDPKNPQPSLDQTIIIFKENPVASWTENKTYLGKWAEKVDGTMGEKELLSRSVMLYPLMHGKLTEPGHQAQLAGSGFFYSSMLSQYEMFLSLLSYPQCTENPAG